jgi:hypothetical protein
MLFSTGHLPAVPSVATSSHSDYNAEYTEPAKGLNSAVASTPGAFLTDPADVAPITGSIETHGRVMLESQKKRGKDAEKTKSDAGGMDWRKSH